MGKLVQDFQVENGNCSLTVHSSLPYKLLLWAINGMLGFWITVMFHKLLAVQEIIFKFSFKFWGIWFSICWFVQVFTRIGAPNKHWWTITKSLGCNCWWLPLKLQSCVITLPSAGPVIMPLVISSLLFLEDQHFKYNWNLFARRISY